MFEKKAPSTLLLTVLMSGVIFLLNLNFTVLRSVRTTLAIADLGGSAAAIPYFELFGVFPATCLMTWLLSYLLRLFSMETVFLMTLTAFIAFYALFACCCYPLLQTWHQEQVFNTPLQVCTMLFYVAGELWKPALIQILFWGLINANISFPEAKRLYPSLLLGASLGSICAGPAVIGCTSEILWESWPLSSSHWGHAFIWMMLLVLTVGIVTGKLYQRLCSFLQTEDLPDKASMSLKASIEACTAVASLRWISWIVLADYLVYSLGEVLFLEVLKHKLPDPCDYCRYMGHLAFWSSVLTLISAVVFTPFCVKRCRWLAIAMALPVGLLLIEGSFFIFLRVENLSAALFGWRHEEWVAVVVGLGSLQYCACRALKYTFFDVSKELAFTALPRNEQMQGKLIVDGICARLGRGGASALSLGFISLAGGILASSFISGIAALLISLSWVAATQKLGRYLPDEKEVIYV